MPEWGDISQSGGYHSTLPLSSVKLRTMPMVSADLQDQSYIPDFFEPHAYLDIGGSTLVGGRFFFAFIMRPRTEMTDGQ